MAEVRPWMLYFRYAGDGEDGKWQSLRLKMKATACKELPVCEGLEHMRSLGRLPKARACGMTPSINGEVGITGQAEDSRYSSFFVSSSFTNCGLAWPLEAFMT